MEMEFFKYVSIIEGFLIVGMLSWEVYWLRKMYQVLQSMPTAEQLNEMVQMMKKDREAVKETMGTVGEMFKSGKEVLSNFFPMVKFPME